MDKERTEKIYANAGLLFGKIADEMGVGDLAMTRKPFAFCFMWTQRTEFGVFQCPYTVDYQMLDNSQPGCSVDYVFRMVCTHMKQSLERSITRSVEDRKERNLHVDHVESLRLDIERRNNAN
jgi:hypothetical protein